MQKQKILHVISGLDVGGAETMLYRLLAHMDQGRWNSKVISLRTAGPIGSKIRELGIPVDSLDIKDLKSLRIRHLRALRKLVAEFSPDIVQGWMYHGNLAAYLGAVLQQKRASILWNVRQTLPSLKNEKPNTRVVIQLSGVLSKKVDKIIFNCVTSVSEHGRVGFTDENSLVIPNGVEIKSSDFRLKYREKTRKQLNIREDEKVLMTVGRYHPKKDQVSFIRASARVANEVDSSRFVMIGREITLSNPRLNREVERLGLHTRFQMLGERQDVLELVAAADVFVSSSSWGEGFSNAIVEAMSIGVPCVATDVGESRRIVGETGMVVSPGDVEMLARKMISAVNLSRDARLSLGTAARARVVKRYSIEKVAETYSSLYDSLSSDHK